MASFVKEKHIRLYKKAITTLFSDLGRIVSIVLPPTEIECPNCKFDSVNTSSMNIFDPDIPYPTGSLGEFNLIGSQPFLTGLCPVCRSVGKIKDENIVRNVKGLTKWLTAKEKELLVKGEQLRADIRIKLPISEYDFVLRATHFIVDGDIVYIAKRPLREGLRDIIKFTFFAKFEDETREQIVEK